MTIQAINPNEMKALLSAIEKADSILLFCHISPDGDTIGSALSLKMMLTRLQKRVTLVLDGIVPSNLFFLPDIYCFRKPEDVAAQMAEGMDVALAIAVDVSCSDRMGAGESLFFQAAVTAQIDHHQTNPGYAQINLIDGDAPATAILIERLRNALGLEIHKEEAICLYTALSTDTGNFVYENTNAEAFLMMSRLMDAGLPLAQCSRTLFRRKEREFLALLTRVLPTLTFFCNGEIAGMQLSKADMKAAGVVGDYTEGIVDYAIDAAGVKMAYFARDAEDGAVKFSLRALSPCRVDTVAELFGGGGHALAAGCTLYAPMEEAVAQVQKALTAARKGSFTGE